MSRTSQVNEWSKSTSTHNQTQSRREEQDALEFEHVMLEKCYSAVEKTPTAASRDEANILNVVAKMIQADYPEVAGRLAQASDAYFMRSGTAPISLERVVAARLVPGLPRLRTLLAQRLKAKYAN